MVRYATAMVERTADREAILRRFTRGNAGHPNIVYPLVGPKH